ncbi:MAG: heavy metal translocating P-type ATPase [Lachnospiraceae bacterium]|nr:heavy metal translocating P-type ATPase [Lachnospiraceae bacterium]
MEQYNVTGMSCAACSARVEKAVSKVDGVTSCSVSLLTNSMGVEGNASPDEIIKAVENAGYGASLRGSRGNGSQNDRGKSVSANNAEKSGNNGSMSLSEEANAGNAERIRYSQQLKEQEEALRDKESPKLVKRLIASVSVLLVLMYFSMGFMMWGWPAPKVFENHVFLGTFEMLLAIIVMMINGKFFVNGFKSLVHLAPNMDALVALGSGASFAYSLVELFIMITAMGDHDHETVMKYGMNLYFESAAMIPTLITIGKLLEARSKGRTTDALKSLMKLSPKTAVIVDNGTEREVPIEELAVGDIFAVRPGGSIPVDGEVIEGNTAVNEAALTGESIPVDKKPGDRVSAATVNQSGYIRCRALRVGEDTTLSQIIKMVSDAAATKAPLARIADKVAGIFVPTVIGLALLTLFGWMIAGRDFTFAIARAITVLVISCPCALGLATPVAIMVGNGVGAKNGILYKTAASLEGLGRTEMIALDKTGTITKGEPEVTDIVPAEAFLSSVTRLDKSQKEGEFPGSVQLPGKSTGISGKKDKKELLRVAASLESKSEHPLGKAICKVAAERKLELTEAAGFVSVPGNGLNAVIDDEKIYGGNEKYILKVLGDHKDSNTDLLHKFVENLSTEGKTPLIFAKETGLLGIIAVADTIKDDSAQAIGELRNMGLKVIMLTGDNKNTAEAIGAKAGVDEVVAGVLPDGKEEVVRNLASLGKTAMVGDGINDAPALVRADCGIAIGAGTDVAIDAADIVLVKSRLTDAAAAVRLSRATIRNIHENLFWAFFYNVICIPLAMGLYGFEMKPMYGAAAMSLSSFFVCMNALRLNMVKLYDTKHDKRISFGRKRELVSAKKIEFESMNSENGYIQEDQEIHKNEEETAMTKTIKVEGMMCEHCEARVKKALEKIEGVESAVASHKDGTAVVTLSKDVDDEVLAAAIEEQDYKVIR